MKQLVKTLALLCMSLWLIAMSPGSGAAPTIPYKIITERTHKPTLFTQGLQIENDQFYESSGLYGKSLLVSYPVEEPEGSTWAKLSAPFTHKQPLPERFFAEGLTLLDDKLYLLTWKEGTLLVYDKTTLHYQKSLGYTGEGWGLTTDGEYLIRSDGSDTLFFHDPQDFRLEKTLKVQDQGKAITRINELEYHAGFIWANIWHEDRIIRIDPNTGDATGELVLSALRNTMKLNNPEQVLNGIAWDEKRNGFWITGKLWPKMFLIQPGD